MKLISILICTLPERKTSFDRVYNELIRQINLTPGAFEAIEILSDDTDRGLATIGYKRETLKKRASGKYVMGIDDDDFPSPHYIQLLIEAARQDADIITFNFNRFVDGVYERTFIINRFLPDGNNWCSKHWCINYNPTHNFTVNNSYYHLCAVKKTIADQVQFIDANNDEDNAYSKALIPIIKTEFRIEHELLNVYYDTKKTQNA